VVLAAVELRELPVASEVVFAIDSDVGAVETLASVVGCSVVVLSPSVVEGSAVVVVAVVSKCMVESAELSINPADVLGTVVVDE